MGSTARVLSQVEREHEHADNDDSPAREKRHILPSGKEGFIRADNVDPKKRKRPSRGRKQWSPARVARVADGYLCDIRKIIKGRHNGPCDTDDGMIYFLPTVELMVMRTLAMEEDGRTPTPLDSYAWAQRWTPKLTVEHPRSWFLMVEKRIIDGMGARSATVPSADELGKQVQATQAEFDRYDLKSIGRIDNLAPQRKVAARKADAERKQNKRDADEKTIPHKESMMQTKPWIALDMSRATYYRKVEKGEITPHRSMRNIRQKRVA